MKSDKNLQSYRSAYIKVSHGHELYYELYGNPNGIPVVFLHGGPGAGFGDNDKKFFDAERYNVLFFDQRGTSRSKPFGSVENNNTQLLIEDINTLLDNVNFKKAYVFGGSWGSTLSLVYAIHHPERVLGLILRGIWLANQYAINHYIGGGIKEFYPEVWNRFEYLVPKGENPVDYYLKMMTNDNKNLSDKYAYEWAYYEMSFYTIKKITDTEEILKTFSYKSMAILEAYFIKNNCFLPEDFIIKNIDRIKDIKTAIVHGRFDFICTPIQAFRLHENLNNSKLNIQSAGHSASDEENMTTLISELKRITSE